MRLKKLILQGFKSFADRTEFVFDAPITGIVGPNGCGKSNVVDGFKWVLGEQSAKSLRGDAMLDVIFNGSGGRKPAGMAEVVLVFENPAREDGTRVLNLDVDEVSVGRRLYRDGASEYQLNNGASRLKDIKELFLDTGVGVDAYSLIEQGRVSALLESNPQERRLIFEEAAGISKFKQRKKESQRKLERVDQNLLRVNDIVEEVAKQLRSVKVQAGRARSYQELSQRQTELRLTYALQEYHTQHQQITQFTSQQQDAQFSLDDAAGDLTTQQSDATLKRDELEALGQAKQQAEHQLVQATAALQSARQRQQYARQQLEQMNEQLEQFAQDKQNVESRLTELAGTLAAEEQNLATLTESLEQHRHEIDQRQQAFRDAQIAMNEATRELEQHKATILDLMRKLASVNSRLGAIRIEQNNIAAQRTRIGERKNVVVDETSGLDAQRGKLQADLDQTLGQMSDRQTQLDQRREQAAQLGKQIAAVSEQLGSSREHRSGLVSRQKLLSDLEARREGVSEGVKSVLRQRDQKFSFIRGLVADVLRVDVEHAHVIEAALDGRDQLLIANHADAVVQAGEALNALEGRVSVLCVDTIPEDSAQDGYDWNRHRQGIRLAIDLVRFEPADAAVAGHLLGRTAIVDSLTDAATLHREGPAGFRYVTRAGQVMEANGAVRAGPFSAAMGLLSRRSELESLAQQVAEADARIEHLAAQLAEGSSAAKSLEAQQNELRTELYRMNSAKVELTSKLAQTADKLSSLARELPVLERELQVLLASSERLAVESQKLSESQAQLNSDQSQRQQRVEELSVEQTRLSQSLKDLGEALTSSRVLLGQVQEKQLASRQQVQRQAAAQAELRQQVDRLTRSAESVGAKRDEVEVELEEAASGERVDVIRKEDLTARVGSLTESVTRLSTQVQELTARVEVLRKIHTEAEKTLHALQLKLSELTVRRETLVQRTLEELQLDLPGRYESIASEAGGYQPGDTDWDAVAAEIKELRERIGRLGNVNLDAINEQEDLEKRQEFLTAQVTDLTSSKQQLEQLIDTINAESGQRFEQTFNAVREHFQGMFRKLFGGGKADIYLETELDIKPSEQQLGPDSLPLPGADRRKVDVLDAGIEIIARPPGKQPVSISQLSGGEKTMTCVALLMSIFKSKPSPFCILDEVDAALDEANNQRFNLIVQEFLSQSQFIVITHSKRTMQMADILYGVTMQEQGVSKRVAVKFDQVDNQGRINETAAA